MQTQNQPTADAPTNETVDINEILKSINDEQKPGDYDVEKFQNNEDVKKIKRKSKKQQKEVASVLESNNETKNKITEIFSRFQKLVAEAKASHEKYYQTSKSHTRILTDKETTQADHAKSSNVNNNLKSLCEQLQKQNQDLIDENKKLQNDEKELRTGLAADFQERINTISTQLEEQAREHLHKSKENEIIKEKLKEVEEKYQSREKIFTEEYDNRHGKFESHYTEIQEKFKSIEDEANKVDEYTTELEKVKTDNAAVEQKLKNLTEKSEIFQQLMTQTNNFFTKIKTEMQKVKTKNEKLDAENIELQKKSERSNISVLELVEENAKLHKEFLKSEAQKEGLNKLIQSLEQSLKEKNDKLKQLQG